jgi:hypothetical protein
MQSVDIMTHPCALDEAIELLGEAIVMLDAVVDHVADGDAAITASSTPWPEILGYIPPAVAGAYLSADEIANFARAPRREAVPIGRPAPAPKVRRTVRARARRSRAVRRAAARAVPSGDGSSGDPPPHPRRDVTVLA